MNPTIPQGTYQFDAEDSYTHFTFQKSYSNINQTDDQGYPIGYGLYITGGSLTVKTNEDGYSVVGYLTDEEKAAFPESYLTEGDFDDSGTIKIFPVAIPVCCCHATTAIWITPIRATITSQ